MEYVRLGEAGLEVSELCLGTWMFGTETEDGPVVDRSGAHAILDEAWERGINFLDTANNYGDGDSERYIGEWLEGRDRENFVVASKVYWATRGRRESGLSRKIVRAEIEDTLDRLGTEYLDIYYVHGWHERSPLGETLSALNDLVRDGLVHYVGVSNFTSWQLVKARWLADEHGWEPPTVIQPRFNALDHHPYTVDPEEKPLPDLLDACRYEGVAVCPYGPLAGGFLTGKYERGPEGAAVGPDGARADLSDNFGPFDDRAWRVLEEVRAVADELDATPAQVAIRWTMEVPGVTSVPIAGATSPEQVADNADAAALSMTAEQFDRIAEVGRPEGSSWPVYVD